MSQRLTAATAFEGLLFLHALSMVSPQAKHKAIKVEMSNMMQELLSLAVLTLSRAWGKLFQKNRLLAVRAERSRTVRAVR